MVERNTNFLLGFGERLTEPIPNIPRQPGEKRLPYTIEEARDQLLPQIEQVADDVDELPDAACPNDEAVAAVTLHPDFLAKSYYPLRLFEHQGLRAVGSRPTRVTPRAWAKKIDPVSSPTVEIFVAGSRHRFSEWAGELANDQEISEEIVRLELLHVPSPQERIRSIFTDEQSVLLEVALHAAENSSADYILEGFRRYLDELDVATNLDRRLYAGGLCFLPIVAPRESIAEVARFSFLRVVREMPKLRPIDPSPFLRGGVPGFRVNLPDVDPIDPELRVAVFDAGLDNPAIERWATPIEGTDIGAAPPGFTDHGNGVTSALLFGSLDPQSVGQPYAYIDHYRVIDEKSSDDPNELYDVLLRIQEVLATRRYQYFSMSIGPDLPIEDDEVHSWTAVLDEFLCDGHTLATLAIGNNGEKDKLSNNARIQVPADCVNGLAVGSSDRTGTNWNRAAYSALGPGRSPGVVKPDVLSFGGSAQEPFHVLDGADMSRPVCGTSFATPAAMRMALGVRAHLGSMIDPLALKALLIHNASPSTHHRQEVGWGVIPKNLEEIITCAPGVVRVLYQGELTPAKYLRARLPLPSGDLQGMVKIRATFCFATPVDPQDPGSYTRSGLDIYFRPHSERFRDDDAIHPTTKPFFRASDFDDEKTLRGDAYKWETVLSKEVRMQAKSLHEPVFDVHHNARMSGKPNVAAEKIRYALIISVEAKKEEDIYNRVVQTYAGQLQVLTPVIEIPVTS